MKESIFGCPLMAYASDKSQPTYPHISRALPCTYLYLSCTAYLCSKQEQ